MPESKQTLYAKIEIAARDEAHAQRMVQGLLARYKATVEYAKPGDDKEDDDG